MSSALCNTCGSLVRWIPQKGKYEKRECTCGSADLTRVYSTLSEDGTKWIYRDSGGKVRAESKLGKQKV